MLKALQAKPAASEKNPKPLKQQSTLTEDESVATEPEVHFTNYLSADVHRRLQIYVAHQKAVKRPGIKISIKGVLNEALDAYLKTKGH